MVEVILHRTKYEKHHNLVSDSIRDELEQDYLFHYFPFNEFEYEMEAEGLDSRENIRGVEDSRELFYLLIEETEDTFYPGIEVSAVITRIVDGRYLFVRLDNGLQGNIDGSDFGDDKYDIDHASHRVSIVGEADLDSLESFGYSYHSSLLSVNVITTIFISIILSCSVSLLAF